ncbi:MAG: hypothetical protein HFK09_06245 [Clostridia bacterium]|nr:hypothetical protein [Clostridia bacterium]
MNRKPIPLFVFCGIFAAAAIALAVGGIITEATAYYLFAVLLGISSVIFLLCGIFTLLVVKTAKKNLADPSTLAYKTYGKGEEYTHIVASPTKSQAGRNAAINAFGILGVLFVGRGFFTFGSGTCPIDVFVSENELITNSAQANGKLLDKKFNRFPASEIADISFISEKKYEDVCISFKGTNKALNLYIRTDKHSTDEVRKTFAKLMKPETGDPFEVPAAATIPEEPASVAAEIQ